MDINERLMTRNSMNTNPQGFEVDDAGDPLDPMFTDDVDVETEPLPVEIDDPLGEKGLGADPAGDATIPETVKDMGQGAVSGLVRGADMASDLASDNSLVGIVKKLGRLAGFDITPDRPKGTAGQVTEAFTQILPTMLPATRLARLVIGTSTFMARVTAEVVGGLVADFATSGKEEADGLVDLVKLMGDGERSALAAAMEEFIAKDTGEVDDAGDPIFDEDNFNTRVLASIPGAIISPVFEGALKLGGWAIKGGAARDFVKLLKEFKADEGGSVKVGDALGVGTVEKPATPSTGQVGMRVNQLAFENDVRSGVIRLDDPLTDLDEVRAIQIEQLDPEIAPLIEQSAAVETRAITANAANLRRTIPATGGKGRRTVKDVGTFLDEQHLQTYGRKLDPTNPEDIEIATQSAVAEIQFQLRQAVSGKGWYETDIDEAFMVASKIDGLASLADNQTHRVIMSAFMSPTSNGKRVPFNMKVGAFNMRQWLDDGTIPFAEPGLTSKGIPKGFGLGLPTNAILANMRLIDGLIKKMGPDDFAEWWLTPHTLGELRALRKEFGLKSGPAKVLGKADRIVMGAKIIGEKTGNFSLAMNGFDVTTKDRWNIRGYNRLFGQNTDTQGLKGIADETGLVDQLRNATEGEQMDAFWSEVSQRVGVDERDTQAVAWYFEQFLYNDLGIVSARPESFSDAARKIAAAPDSIRRDVPGGSVRQGNDTQATAQPASPRSGGDQ